MTLSRNMTAATLVGVIALSIGPAWNTTIAELSDKYDDSETTRFQPDVLIQAWGDGFAQIGIAALALFVRREEQSKKTENEPTN